MSLVHSAHAIVAGSYYLLLCELNSHEGLVASLDRGLLPSMALLLFVLSLLLVEATPTYSRLPKIMKHILDSPLEWGAFSLAMFFSWVLMFDHSFDYIDLSKLQLLPTIAYFALPIYSVLSWLALSLDAIGFFQYLHQRFPLLPLSYPSDYLGEPTLE